MKKRDPKQELIDRQAQEVARLRAAVQSFVEVTDYQGQRIVELELALREASKKSQPGPGESR